MLLRQHFALPLPIIATQPTQRNQLRRRLSVPRESPTPEARMPTKKEGSRPSRPRIPFATWSNTSRRRQLRSASRTGEAEDNHSTPRSTSEDFLQGGRSACAQDLGRDPRHASRRGSTFAEDVGLQVFSGTGRGASELSYTWNSEETLGREVLAPKDIASQPLFVKFHSSSRDRFPGRTRVPIKEQASFCHDVFRIVRTSRPS